MPMPGFRWLPSSLSLVSEEAGSMRTALTTPSNSQPLSEFAMDLEDGSTSQDTTGYPVLLGSQARQASKESGYEPLVAVRCSSKAEAAGSPSACSCVPQYPVIDPHHSITCTVWEIFVTSLTFLFAFSAPFQLTFLKLRIGHTFVYDRCMDIVFLLDMILQFFLAKPDPHRPERYLKDPSAIVRKYLRGWFVVDFVSLLPVDTYIVLHHAGGTGAGPSLLLRALRLHRLVRLMRLSRCAKLMMQFQYSYGFSYATCSLAKCAIVVVLGCHWMACLWASMATCSELDEGSWLTALRDAKGGPPELYEGKWHIYLMSLYWAIVTLTSIGYGDIVPQTPAEYSVATLCTSVMAGFWAYLIGAICATVATMNPHEVQFRRTMDDLNWIMSDRSMPRHFAKQLRKYFHESRDLNRQRVEQDVIAQMSPHLQGEFALFMHQKWITKVWYLRDMNHEVIVWAARHMSMAVFAPNEEVLNTRTLFIVRKGVAALYGKVLATGDVWGEDMLLSNDALRNPTKARSLSYLSVLMLHMIDLVEIVYTYPEARVRLRWAQVQIAIRRGVTRIAAVIKNLKTTAKLNEDAMTDDERMKLFAEILRGKYNSGMPRDDDCFGMADRDTISSVRSSNLGGSWRCKRSNLHHAPSLGCISDDSHPASREEHAPIEADVHELKSTVAELKESLQSMTCKLDRSLALGAFRAPSGQSAQELDLGSFVSTRTLRASPRAGTSASLLGRQASTTSASSMRPNTSLSFRDFRSPTGQVASPASRFAPFLHF
eukprot:TRINITY_DN40346_c0_g1_i1.p1 TRINITY_DN40346_c0_g1~~TRINITY_DN40346_c0_g1_i1.p1  ORF type:complete len:769 (+),score=85.96 TRINITY_DN40346_c0_g1_i1:55-2361(+)